MMKGLGCPSPRPGQPEFLQGGSNLEKKGVKLSWDYEVEAEDVTDAELPPAA